MTNILAGSFVFSRATSCACLAGVALLVTSVVQADDGIVTDRPDFVESSDVVGLGRQQIEVGLSLDSLAESGITQRTFTTPTLLRLGFGQQWEARIETDGLIRSSTSGAGFDDHDNGMADIALGVKVHLQDYNAGKPGLALLLHADLASGSSAFRGEGVRPSVRMVAEWEVGESSSFGVMPGVMFDRNSEHSFTSGILAATYGFDINAALRGFVELAGQQLLVKEEDGGDVVTFDAGVSHAMGMTTQIDASINIGLTKYSPDWVVGFGFAHRFGDARAR